MTEDASARRSSILLFALPKRSERNIPSCASARFVEVCRKFNIPLNANKLVRATKQARAMAICLRALFLIAQEHNLTLASQCKRLLFHVCLSWRILQFVFGAWIAGLFFSWLSPLRISLSRILGICRWSCWAPPAWTCIAFSPGETVSLPDWLSNSQGGRHFVMTSAGFSCVLTYSMGKKKSNKIWLHIIF